MQKGTIKAIVLPVVFVLAVIIFSFMTNQTNEDLTTEMSEATLPVLTLYDGKTATVLSEMTSPVFRSSTVIFGAP